MPIVPFGDLMAAAAAGGYAVGYFECWDLESCLAVADAAAAKRSPVMLGFSGIYLPDPTRVAREPLSVYAAMGLETCRRTSVPACLVFNESPHAGAVREAVALGFQLVMFSDERLDAAAQADETRRLVEIAHRAGVAVEGELDPLPGVGGELHAMPAELRLSDPGACRAFVAETGVDALAVNIGQAHLHGRREVRLDLARLLELQEAVQVPLVLHGATSVAREDLRAAVRGGIRKVNVGSILKRTYFEALRTECARVHEPYNPYLVVGSGAREDVLTTARLALARVVAEWMDVLGSSGRA